MSQVISVMGNKGGQTKTTVSTTLAVALSIVLPNEPILLIECDGQGNASESLRIEPFDGLYALLYQDAEFADVMVRVGKAVTGRKSNLYVIPSQTGGQNKVDREDAETPRRLIKTFHELREWARFVIVDSSPAQTATHVGLYYASDYVVLPTLVEEDGVNSVAKMVRFLKQAEDRTQQPDSPYAGYTAAKILGILPNRFIGRNDPSALRQLGRVDGALDAGYHVFPKIDEKPVWRRARDLEWSIYAHAKGADSDYDRKEARVAIRQFNHLVQSVLALESELA